LEKLSEIVKNPVLPDDLAGTKEMIEEHSLLKKKAAKVPMNALDEEGQRIIQRICGRHAAQAGNGQFTAEKRSILFCAWSVIAKITNPLTPSLGRTRILVRR